MNRTLIALALAALSASAPAQPAPNTATITFTPPTTLADGSALPAGSALTFNVYQGAQGQPKVFVAAITGSPGSIVSGLPTGKTYCFQVSAVLGGLEGALSNEACKSFIAPGTFVIKVN